MMNGSTWRCVLWSTRLLGSKPYSWSAGFTSQAIRHFWSDASKRVIVPAPLFDARMFAQVVSEARFVGDLVGIDTEMFDDDLLHAIGGLAHGGLSFLLSLNSP